MTLPVNYRKEAFLHGYGLAAARPLDALPGTFYYSTDTKALERFNGTTWDSYVGVPSNAALVDISNTFTQSQYIQDAGLVLEDTTQAANQKKWGIIPNGSALYVYPLKDDNTPVGTFPFILDRFGSMYISQGIYEAGRAFRMGVFSTISFSAGNFSGQSPMTWTIGSGAVIKNAYTAVGNLIFWTLYVSWFSGSNALSGTASNRLNLTVPGGLTITGSQAQPVTFCAGIAGVPNMNGLYALLNGTNFEIYKYDNSNFALTDVPGLITTFVFEAA